MPSGSRVRPADGDPQLQGFEHLGARNTEISDDRGMDCCDT